MKRTWREKELPIQNTAQLEGFDPLVARLLLLRDIKTREQADEFLHLQYEKSHDPFLLKDMDQVVERILKAIERKEHITIYADYDADAVTAAAVLLRFFQKISYENIDYYIPDRFSEGYGMHPDAVRELAERGTKLIVTVDCGINAFEAVHEAKKHGVDVVVTDHHQVQGKIPDAVAVVNPHRADDVYPFKDLTGVGVAFKLVQALQKNLQLQPGQEKWLLDLVAIGTVADCQSLLGENRIFVKWGFHVLGKTRWIGLQKLIELAGLSEQSFDTYKIGFVIAPRINAAGRIEHANLALELLLTDDEDHAATLAQKLDDLNRRRQDLTQQIMSEAREQLITHSDRKVLLAAGDDWPKGIVGLVAGKLTEEFYRPVLVLSKNGTEAVGSARSIAQFNIVEAISRSGEILMRYGGHAQAAGFTLHPDHIDLFHKNLLTYADEVLTEDDFSPVVYYDAEIDLYDITPTFVDTLERFEPFGIGNPRPRFRINNVATHYIQAVGREEKHLKMHISKKPSGEKIGAIGFGLGFWGNKLNDGDVVSIICEPQWNEWNGNKSIQLKIIDIAV